MSELLFFITLMMATTPVAGEAVAAEPNSTLAAPAGASRRQVVVTEEELDRLLGEAIATMDSNISFRALQQMRRQTAERMVTERLLEMRMFELGIIVSQREIDQRLEAILASEGQDRGRLAQALQARYGLTVEQYLAQTRLRERIGWEKLFEVEIGPIEITGEHTPQAKQRLLRREKQERWRLYLEALRKDSIIVLPEDLRSGKGLLPLPGVAGMEPNVPVSSANLHGRGDENQ